MIIQYTNYYQHHYIHRNLFFNNNQLVHSLFYLYLHLHMFIHLKLLMIDRKQILLSTLIQYLNHKNHQYFSNNLNHHSFIKYNLFDLNQNQYKRLNYLIKYFHHIMIIQYTKYYQHHYIHRNLFFNNNQLVHSLFYLYLHLHMFIHLKLLMIDRKQIPLSTLIQYLNHKNHQYFSNNLNHHSFIKYNLFDLNQNQYKRLNYLIKYFHHIMIIQYTKYYQYHYIHRNLTFNNNHLDYNLFYLYLHLHMFIHLKLLMIDRKQIPLSTLIQYLNHKNHQYFSNNLNHHSFIKYNLFDQNQNQYKRLNYLIKYFHHIMIILNIMCYQYHYKL